MADGGKVIIKIDGDDTGFQKSAKNASSVFSKIGGVAKGAFGAVAAGTTVAAGAIVGVGTAAVKSYSEYEQLVGGVETLFGTRGAKSVQEYAQTVGKSVDYVNAEFGMLQEAQSKVMENASNAYKTAGMSANEYMNTVNGVASALNQSSASQLESADLANMAVLDMSDNANKMGTNMNTIIGTYQSLARGNYAMLDNLKLGFGGTKEEMQRLLDTAQQISGVKYDISSFSDIVSAIHVVQEEMGITGTTASEAAGTIQGSAAMMKASWENLLVGLADPTQNFDALIQNFMTSVEAFATNLMPVIGNVLSALPGMIESLGTKLFEALPGAINSLLPQIAQSASQLILTLVDVLTTNASSIGETLMSVFSTISSTLGKVLSTLAKSITSNASSFTSAAGQMASSFLQGFTSNISGIVSVGAEMIASLVNGISAQIPTLLPLAVEAVMSFLQAISSNAPTLLSAGLQLITSMGQGISNAIPTITAMLPGLVSNMLNALISAAPQLISAGFELISNLINGLMNAAPNLYSAIPGIISSAVQAFKNVLPQFIQVGKDIINGVIQGIKNAGNLLFSTLKDLASRALSAAKSALGIKSPSRLFRDEVGRWIPRGIAVGIEMASGYVEKSLDKVFEKIGKKTDNEMSDLKKRTDEYAKQISEIFDITSDYARGGILLNPGDEYGHHDVLRFMKAETLELKKQAKSVQEIYDIHLAYFNKLESDTKMKEWPYRGEWQKYRDEAFDELLKLEEDLIKIEEEMLSDMESNISDHYQHMSSSAINAIDAIEQKQKELTSKISSNFKLLEQAENGRLSLANLSKHSEGMTEYYNNLKRLKEVAPKELYEEILGMSTQEGGSFMYTFFAASQTEQQKFIDDYKNIYTQAAEGAKNAFVEETADVEKQIMDEFSKTPEDFFQIGKDSLKKFGEGFYENLSEMMSGIRNTMSSLLGNLFPQVEYAGVGSRVYNDNSNITIIAGSKSERDMIEELEQRKIYEQQVRGW